MNKISSVNNKFNIVFFTLILLLCVSIAVILSTKSFATENIKDSGDSSYQNKPITSEVINEDSQNQKIDNNNVVNEYTYYATGTAKDCYENRVANANITIVEQIIDEHGSATTLKHTGKTANDGTFKVALTSPVQEKHIMRFDLINKGTDSNPTIWFYDYDSITINADKDYGNLKCPFYTTFINLINRKTPADMKEYGKWYYNGQPLTYINDDNGGEPGMFYYEKGTYSYLTQIKEGVLTAKGINPKTGLDVQAELKFVVNEPYILNWFDVEPIGEWTEDGYMLSSNNLTINAYVTVDPQPKPTPYPINYSVIGKIVEKNTRIPVKATIYFNSPEQCKTETDENGNYKIVVPKDIRANFCVIPNDEALSRIRIINKDFKKDTYNFNFELERHNLVPLTVNSTNEHHDHFINAYFWKDGKQHAASKFSSYNFNIWEGETYYVKDGILYFNLLDDHYGQPSYMDFQAFGKDKYVVDKWTINGKVVTEEENIASNEEKIDVKCSYVYKEDVPPTPEPPSKDVTPAASNAEGGTASSQTGDVMPYAIAILSIVVLSSLGVFTLRKKFN